MALGLESIKLESAYLLFLSKLFLIVLCFLIAYTHPKLVVMSSKKMQGKIQ